MYGETISIISLDWQCTSNQITNGTSIVSSNVADLLEIDKKYANQNDLKWYTGRKHETPTLLKIYKIAEELDIQHITKEGWEDSVTKYRDIYNINLAWENVRSVLRRFKSNWQKPGRESFQEAANRMHKEYLINLGMVDS